MSRWGDEAKYPIEAIESHLSRAKLAGFRNHRKRSMSEKLEPPTCGRNEPVLGRDLTRSVDERVMGAQLTVVPRLCISRI
jgi:hypothetical protein